MKIMIVDDTIAYRSQLKNILTDIDGIEVVATAANGKIALQKIEQIPVDLVILDIEMPEMDGLQTVKEIKQRGYSDIKIIMFSGLSRSATSTTLEALHLGANDVVAKPGDKVRSMEDAVAHIKTELVSKILQFRDRRPTAPAAPAPKPTAQRAGWRRVRLRDFYPRVVVIASSTGGPQALEDLFLNVGSSFCPPILIVQHMPPVFTDMLARRLDKISPMQFEEAKDGQPVRKGRAYIAPGDFHMELKTGPDGGLQVGLHQKAKENSVRPAADFLFRSTAEIIASNCLGIVLTGMGQDGKLGALAIKNAGGAIFIQNKASCVVWGMPAAVHSDGAYDETGTIDDCRRVIQNLSDVGLGG